MHLREIKIYRRPFKALLTVEIDRFYCFMRVWKIIHNPLVLQKALITIGIYFCEDQEVWCLSVFVPSNMKNIKNHLNRKKIILWDWKLFEDALAITFNEQLQKIIHIFSEKHPKLVFLAMFRYIVTSVNKNWD